MAKKSLVNLSLDSEFVEQLKIQSKSHGFEKLSDYVQDWLKKLGLDKTGVKRVVMQIPEDVIADRQSLERWLQIWSAKIVNNYFPS